MSFMQPYVTQEPFWVVDTGYDSFVIPDYGFDMGHVQDAAVKNAGRDVTVTYYPDKWWGRYSADGYTDCTDWSGPHETERGAFDAIQELYGEEAEFSIVTVIKIENPFGAGKGALVDQDASDAPNLRLEYVVEPTSSRGEIRNDNVVIEIVPNNVTAQELLARFAEQYPAATEISLVSDCREFHRSELDSPKPPLNDDGKDPVA